MGSVWTADHLTLGTQVAIKFIDPELVKEHPTLRTRFTREAKAAAVIKSPHVVRVFDHGEMEDGTSFIVMELLEGESLSERLERAGPLSFAETVELLSQTAKALRKAHKLGIVHRDLKPDNLFLVDSGIEESDEEPAPQDIFVKVLDFGVAKHTKTKSDSVVTMVGATIGTPEYMSPEQILSSKDVDFRADLWALAVVTYEALTAIRPFHGETVGALWQSITKSEFEAVSSVLYDEGRISAPSYPELDDWFAAALNRDPEQRFKSARSMAMAFSRALPANDDDIHERSTDRPPTGISEDDANYEGETKIVVDDPGVGLDCNVEEENTVKAVVGPEVRKLLDDKKRKSGEFADAKVTSVSEQSDSSSTPTLEKGGCVPPYKDSSPEAFEETRISAPDLFESLPTKDTPIDRGERAPSSRTPAPTFGGAAASVYDEPVPRTRSRGLLAGIFGAAVMICGIVVYVYFVPNGEQSAPSGSPASATQSAYTLDKADNTFTRLTPEPTERSSDVKLAGSARPSTSASDGSAHTSTPTRTSLAAPKQRTPAPRPSLSHRTKVAAPVATELDPVTTKPTPTIPKSDPPSATQKPTTEPKADCDPPYTIDKDGIQIPKKGCY